MLVVHMLVVVVASGMVAEVAAPKLKSKSPPTADHFHPDRNPCFRKTARKTSEGERDWIELILSMVTKTDILD
eukprot:m.97866 g.97866  ORF g.97866 m.97866 type:complete len:73 (+) comp27017_c1_seq1:841-1059(+)